MEIILMADKVSCLHSTLSIKTIKSFLLQVAVLTLETFVARAVGIHFCIHDNLHGVQVHPHHGAAGGGGEPDQMV